MKVVGCFGYGVHNREGISILDFCRYQNLVVVNTLFKKDREKYITYKSGDAETRLDLILMRKRRDIRATDCKVIHGEAWLSRWVCANIPFKYFKKKMLKGQKKIRVWKLKDETTRRLFEERFEEKITSSTGEWKDLQDSIMAAGMETCGLTSGKRRKERETWWSEGVQQKLKEKRVPYKKWQGKWGLLQRKEEGSKEIGGSCKENCVGAVEW